MGTAERKEREKAEVRKMILDAAMELFIKEGYDSVSIRKIADKIEYSPGSIYTYFEDKASLFYALHVEGFGILYQKQLSAQSIIDPRERLIAHGRAYIEFAVENQQYYDIMFIQHEAEEIICKEKNWDHGHRSYDLLKRNVAECKAAGMFKDLNLDSVAFVLWSTVHGIVSLVIRRGVALKELVNQENNIIIESGLNILRSFIR
ncbi:MAG TPA: TetR/AcrR family transcriptional regulator [Ignavibacteriaceae bacterium]|nr:TetR/AcrR family transcriptional regulator [Ignavibacteriaceae bacterium]